MGQSQPPVTSDEETLADITFFLTSAEAAHVPRLAQMLKCLRTAHLMKMYGFKIVVAPVDETVPLPPSPAHLRQKRSSSPRPEGRDGDPHSE